jgi:hypothetical protein
MRISSMQMEAAYGTNADAHLAAVEWQPAEGEPCTPMSRESSSGLSVSSSDSVCRGVPGSLLPSSASFGSGGSWTGLLDGGAQAPPPLAHTVSLGSSAAEDTVADEEWGAEVMATCDEEEIFSEDCWAAQQPAPAPVPACAEPHAFFGASPAAGADGISPLRLPRMQQPGSYATPFATACSASPFEAPSPRDMQLSPALEQLVPAPCLGADDVGASAEDRAVSAGARARACRVLAQLWANSERPPWLLVRAARCSETRPRNSSCCSASRGNVMAVLATHVRKSCKHKDS